MRPDGLRECLRRSAVLQACRGVSVEVGGLRQYGRIRPGRVEASGDRTERQTITVLCLAPEQAGLAGRCFDFLDQFGADQGAHHDRAAAMGSVGGGTSWSSRGVASVSIARPVADRFRGLSLMFVILGSAPDQPGATAQSPAERTRSGRLAGGHRGASNR